MKQITLRFPEVGYDRLLRLCDRYGISFRALFEAATLIALEDEESLARSSPQATMWEIARCLEASAEFRARPQHRLVVTLDDEVHRILQVASSRFGVSMNAALALVVMPWPDAPELPAEYRHENLRRIVEQARRLDYCRGRSVSNINGRILSER